MYYDLLCYYSALYYDGFQDFLASNYDDKTLGSQLVLDLVEVNYSFVPLPYHHSSWIPATVTPYVINKCQADMATCQFHDFLKFNFDNQDTLLNAVDTPYDDLVTMYKADLVTKFGFPIADLDQIYSEFDLQAIAFMAANDYQLGTSNQVSGTPTVFVNGIKLDTFPTTAETWAQILETLVAAQ